MLNEANSNDLVSGTIRKTTLTKPEYNNARVVKYLHRTKNFTFNIKKYFVNLRLTEIPVIGRLKGKDEEKLDIGLSSEIKVSCTCPDFLYGGFKYIGTQLSYSTHKENRPPDIRNPRQAGTVCKHVGHILNNIDKFKPEMVDFIKRSREGKYKVVSENVLANLVESRTSDEVLSILEFTDLKRLRSEYRENLPSDVHQLKYGDLLIMVSDSNLEGHKYQRLLVVKNPSNKEYAICFNSDKRKYVVIMNADIKNSSVGHSKSYDADMAITLRTNDSGIISAIEKEPKIYRNWK